MLRNLVVTCVLNVYQERIKSGPQRSLIKLLKQLDMGLLSELFVVCIFFLINFVCVTERLCCQFESYSSFSSVQRFCFNYEIDRIYQLLLVYVLVCMYVCMYLCACVSWDIKAIHFP